MQDKKRSIQSHLRYLTAHFPCVAILGARQVGKSTLLKHIWPNADFFDLEDSYTQEKISGDVPFFLNQLKNPVIFDEAQLCPEIFPALRIKIDQNRAQNGQFLISGSSSPTLLHHISESLAGRVAIIQLGTFLWNEAWDTPLSQFYELIIAQKFQDLPQLNHLYSTENILSSCFYGGYPQPFVQRQAPKYGPIWMQNYIDTYIQRDIRQLFPGLNNDAYRRFIKMLAFSSGQTIKYADFARSIGVSEPTIRSYFDIAQGTFLWRQIPAFDKSSKKRLVKAPKGYIRDSGLSLFLHNIFTTDDYLHQPNFGRFWESAVTEQLINGFQTQIAPLQFSYYRTQSQAEIDLIVEGPFGCIPIEIKSGALVRHTQLIALKEFIDVYNCPIGIVINQSSKIEYLAKNIIQIPANFI